MTDEPIRIAGEGRRAGSQAPVALEFVLEAEGFAFRLGSEPVRRAAYRDVATIAIADQAGFLAIGRGPGGEELLLERFGVQLGGLIRELRDRRLRQVLADRFVELPGDRPIELVEYAAPAGAGIAQFAAHPWGSSSHRSMSDWRGSGFDGARSGRSCRARRSVACASRWPEARRPWTSFALGRRPRASRRS